MQPSRLSSRLTPRQRAALLDLSQDRYPSGVSSITAVALQSLGFIEPGWYLSTGRQLVATVTEAGRARLALKRGRKPKKPQKPQMQMVDSGRDSASPGASTPDQNSELQMDLLLFQS